MGEDIMFLTPINDPAFTGLLSLYKLNNNLVWQDLYTERQKLYYIYFKYKNNLNDPQWHLDNENVSNLYDYYNRYLKLRIGEFSDEDNLDFITQHDWTYYDKIYDNGKTLKVNNTLLPSFELYTLIRNNIVNDILKSNLDTKIKLSLFNQYSIIKHDFDFEGNDEYSINNTIINLEGLNYYFKYKKIPYGKEFNKFDIELVVKFWQNDTYGDITQYIDDTFTK